MAARAETTMRTGLTRLKAALLAILMAAAGVLALSTPAWAAGGVRVRVVDDTGKIFNVTAAESHDTWSYDGNGVLILNGFHGKEIAYEGGDFTVAVFGENTLETGGSSEHHGGVYYYPFNESPTEHGVTISGTGTLMCDGSITNLGGVFIDGPNVTISHKGSSEETCQMLVSSRELAVANDARLAVNGGGISTGAMLVKDSALSVAYTLTDETVVKASGFVTWDNSFIEVQVKDGNTAPSVTSTEGFTMPHVGGGWNPSDDGKSLRGNVNLVPNGFMLLKDIDENTPHLMDIMWLHAHGITMGFPDGTFKPYASVARCDMAAFLYRLAGKPAFTPTEADKAYFSDVTEETDHALEIWWLAHEGISKGWDETDGSHTFRPYLSIARCDMAAFLYRLAGEPEFTPMAADKERFSDVDNNTAHHDEVWWLASTGISTGFPDGTFKPLNKIARCDMAAFLHRMDNMELV